MESFAVMRKTPLRPGTKPLQRRKPLTAKQRSFLKHKAKERVRQLWTEKAGVAKLQPLKTLRERAWSAFSKYVRLRDSVSFPNREDGPNVRCITCRNYWHWKDMHAGHFVHAGRANPVTYDERNVNAQCPACNTFLHGKLDVYATRLIERYGMGVTDELRAMKAQSKPLNRTQLHEIALKYEAKVEEMLNG